MRAWLETQQAGSRPATVNRRLSSLRAFYGWAERQGLLSQNPLAGMRSLKVLPPAAGPLEPQALENLLRVARQAGRARDRAMLEVLADTGLRPRELCALRRRDLERQGAQAWLVIGQGKNQRRVDLSTRARVALSDYLAGQPPAGAEAPLFTSRGGQAVTPFILWHVLRGCAAQAGLAEVTPLDLRRAAVLRFLRASDADLLAAGERFGEHDLNRLSRLLDGLQAGG